MSCSLNRRAAIRGATGALLFLAAACSPKAHSTRWTGTQTDSAGIVLVENTDRGMWSESDRWVVEEDLRIGSLGGDPDYQFGQIGTIAISSEGDILVSDRHLRQVRVFSKEGTYLRSIGVPGSGPGELGRGAVDVLLTVGDTLLVPDTQNRRINRFGPDGTSLESFPLDPAKERPLRFNWNPVSHAITAQVRPAPAESGSARTSVDAIRVVETSGAFGDTLLEMPSGGLFDRGGLRYFTPEPMWDVTDSLTVVYAVNNDYRISFYGRDGSLQRIVRRAFEPRPITDRDIRAFFAYLDRAWLDAGVPPSMLEANHQRISFAEFLPAFASFQIGYGGSLWVQPVRSPATLSEEEIERYNFVEDFGASDWDVFDRAGRYLGVVNMPPRFQPRLFHEAVIYGVWRDELDVQYVVRLHVKDRQT